MPSPGWDFYFPSMCFLQSSVADSCCFKLYFMKHVRSSSSPFSTFYHSSNLSLMAIATNPCGLLSGKDLCEARQIWEEYQSVLNSFVEIILFHRFSEKKRFYPQHMKVPRLGVASELWLLAYTTVRATPDLSCIYHLYHSSWQRQILNHWARPEIKPASSWILVGFINC